MNPQIEKVGAVCNLFWGSMDSHDATLPFVFFTNG